MAALTLITGGSRSGKSSFAQKLAEERPGSHLFMATCPVTDSEMEARILRHVQDRQKGNWDTIEEPVNIVGELQKARHYDTILVDCMTLWINNLMYEAEKKGLVMDEDTVQLETDRLVRAVHDHPGAVILVTNEVGLGIVPDNAAARLFRDLVGRCNQCLALGADRVYLVSCGIPLEIKS